MAVTCVSIIMGVNLVYHEYCILPGGGITSKICLLTAALADKDNSSSDVLLSDNSSNSQETFLLKGGKFVLGWLVGVSTLHVHARSPSLTMKTQN